MDIIQLYQDFNIDFVSEGHKHCREGWVNIECPFCTGNPGYHLGYNIEEEYFHCWRCGGKFAPVVFSKILNLPHYKLNDILKPYDVVLNIKKKKKPKPKKDFKYPSNLINLGNNHVRYLQDRNFDPYHLINLWDLKATGPISKLDKIDYKHRIIIPYHWDNQVVTFDSRSISKNATDTIRYIACPLKRELVPRKDILYGLQVYWKDTGIVVEGPTDVWRLGTSSCATSGIQYTNKQLRLLAKTFKRIAVIFDDQPQAIIQANKLVADLKFRGIDAFRIDIEGDPGSMSQEDADYLIKTIL